MHKHALCVELYTPIIVCGKPTKEIVVLKVECSDEESEHLTRNVLNAINTNAGTYSFIVSDNTGDPFNPQTITLKLQDIKEIWKIN